MRPHTRFPDTPAFSRHNAPTRLEASVQDLEVEGELPEALQGTWYRLTPEPQFPPALGDDIYLSGDGMISALSFRNGRIDYRSRYVRTERFMAERDAGRALFGAYRNPFTDDPSVAAIDRTVANTTPVWHAGKLLAMKEDGLPYEVDPATLATRGRFDWHGRLRSCAVSAHPKIDPQTGELLLYGYQVEGLGSRTMSFAVIAPDGHLRREEWFEAPTLSMVHDFAVTRDYVIFPLFPTLLDVERIKARGPFWMTDIAADLHVGIMPREGGAGDMRWFRRPGGQGFHAINAWNDGPRVYVDFLVSEMNPFPFFPDVSGIPYDPARAAPRPTRWAFDMSRGGERFEETLLGPIPGDLPRIDERLTGLPYRYAYMGMVDPARPMPDGGPTGAGFNMIGRLDTHTGASSLWYGEDTHTFQEPQFVASGNAEDDGYVLAVIDRHADNLTDVGVFDARAMERGPVALIHLPLRLRTGIHGTWVPQDAVRPVSQAALSSRR